MNLDNDSEYDDGDYGMEFNPQIKKHDFALYLDMDGVFSSFETRVKEVFPDFHKLEGQYSDEIECSVKRDLNNRMVEAVKSTENFWSHLPWHTEGAELFKWIYNMIPHENVAVLTAPISRDERCEAQKRIWLEKNFHGMICLETRFFCDDDKAKYINSLQGKHQILVDDRPKNILNWMKAGGLGILHDPENVQKTIDRLRIIRRDILKLKG